MLVKCDFSIDAYIRGLKVDVKSEDKSEVFSKVYEAISNAISDCNLGDLKDADISDLETEVLSADYKVRAYDIKYEVDEYEIKGFEDMDALEQDLAINKVAEKLPKELTLNLSDIDPKNLIDEIESEILLKIDNKAKVINFGYEVLETK